MVSLIKFNKNGFILTLAFCFVAVSCEKPSLKQVPAVNEPELKPEPKPEPERAKATEVSFPIDRILNDSRGRATDVSIIGREKDNLTFVRKPDGKRFTFPIAKLSTKDRAFVSSLPIKPPPEEEKNVKKSNYVSIREKEIERLNAKLEDLQEEAAGFGGNRLRLKGVSRAMKKVRAEISTIEEQIATYK